MQPSEVQFEYVEPAGHLPVVFSRPVGAAFISDVATHVALSDGPTE